jgi:hypothetical protein
MSRIKLRAKLRYRNSIKAEDSLLLSKSITLKNKSILVHAEDEILYIADTDEIVFQYVELLKYYRKRIKLDTLSAYDCAKILKHLCIYE